jgi:Mg-chelatase subunit ChlD
MSNHDKDKLATTSPPTALGTTINASGRVKVGAPLLGIHAKLAAAQARSASETNEIGRCPNRLALMLDTSGSMRETPSGGYAMNENDSGSKIAILREAMQAFIANCDALQTALALDTFGDTPQHFSLATDYSRIKFACSQLVASGGTPLAVAMNLVFASISLTRGIIISDGEPENEQECFAIAENYKSTDTPIDCVHIGTSERGESCLRRIAQITNGVYIKFADLTSFVGAIKALTPAFRAQLFLNGATSALGASEVITNG